MVGLVSAPVSIGQRLVGDGQPCYVIAEAGVNHNGELAMARELVRVAAAAGADAVKFQTFAAEELVSPTAPKAAYQRDGAHPSESQFEMLRKLELDAAAFRAIADACHDSGITFLSSPFDDRSLDLLVSLGLPAIKLGSGELTNGPFIRRAASARPVILSTGMATQDEVATAVSEVREVGGELVVLQCVTSYPALPEHSNLRAMRTMSDAFDVPVGYSDHAPGIGVSLAAVAAGACVIEKHFTLDRGLPGPDHAASLEPQELAELVVRVRGVESMLGDGVKRPAPGEGEMAAVARKSLVATRDLAPGTKLTLDDMAVRRPGSGLPPARRDELVGRVIRRAVAAGAMLLLEDLE
jgi:N,N'-diacetyllegionaminate synthase